MAFGHLHKKMKVAHVKARKLILMPTSVTFTKEEGLPRAPYGLRLHRLRFGSCPGSDLSLVVVRDVVNVMDTHGVPQDSWWSVRTPGLPLRTLRLFSGSHSLMELLKRYSFQDATGCPHQGTITAEYQPRDTPLPHDRLASVPSELRAARGVPQFSTNSGVCWFSAICWCFFAPQKMRRWIKSFMPSEMGALVDKCLFDRNAAVSLRELLWREYHIGDDVDQPPEMDGRNGFSEWTTLCAKLKIPLVRYEWDGYARRLQVMGKRVRDRKGHSVSVTTPARRRQRHLLALRFVDGDHGKYPVRRQMTMNGVVYELVGVVSGSRKCGHQISWCVLDDWRHLAAGDADLHKDGIGPLFIHFEGREWEKEWWNGCRQMLHVTKFGAGRHEFCSLSPWNENDGHLNHYRGAPGSNSLDIIYSSSKYTER